MPNQIQKKYIKTFELNKDDLANIHGRLKSADYFYNLAIADIYQYIKLVILKRMGLPEDWVIRHDEEWTKITVISPDYADEFDKQNPEQGGVVRAATPEVETER